MRYSALSLDSTPGFCDLYCINAVGMWQTEPIPFSASSHHPDAWRGSRGSPHRPWVACGLQACMQRVASSRSTSDFDVIIRGDYAAISGKVLAESGCFSVLLIPQASANLYRSRWWLVKLSSLSWRHAAALMLRLLPLLGPRGNKRCLFENLQRHVFADAVKRYS